MHPSLNPLRRALVWLTLIPLVIQVGCVTAPPPVVTSPPSVPTMEVRKPLGTVTIVPAQYAPRTDFATYVDKPSAVGAVKGGLGELFGFHGPAAFIPIIAFMWDPVVAVAVFVLPGAIIGAEKEGHTESVPVPEINSMVAKLDTQRALAEYLSTIVQQDKRIQLRAVNAIGPIAADEHPTYSALQPDGIDTVLEVAVSEIGFTNIAYYGNKCQNKMQNSLYMLAQARLVRVSDGTEFFAQRYHYESPCHNLAQWKNDKLLTDTLEGAYRDITNRMNDDALLFTPTELPAN